MPTGSIYVMLKYVLGRWLDLFLVLLFIISWYKEWLVYEIFIRVMEFLLFLYFYKCYHWFFRHFFNNETNDFKWTLFDNIKLKRCLSYEFYIELRFIILLLMPWNLIWVILLYICGYWKLMKVWFNGNKDILIMKWFRIDIRESFDRYIMWYYKWINPVVEFFIHKPILRILIFPSIMRNVIVGASIFQLFKVRMFIFVFLSLLSINELSLYGWMTEKQLILMIYVYFLLIWPKMAKYFGIEKILYANKIPLAYATPESLYCAYLITNWNSISLSFLDTIKEIVLDSISYKKYILFSDNLFLPGWLMFLFNDVFIQHWLNSNVNILFNILFWRYEKIHSSILAFFGGRNNWTLLLSLACVILINEGVVPKYMTKIQLDRIYKKVELISRVGWCVIYDVSDQYNVCYNLNFYDWFDSKVDVNKHLITEKVIIENQSIKRIIEWSNKLDTSQKIEKLWVDVGLREYKGLIEVISFYSNSLDLWPDNDIKEFTDWLILHLRFLKSSNKNIDSLNNEQKRVWGLVSEILQNRCWFYASDYVKIFLKKYLEKKVDWEKTYTKEEEEQLEEDFPRLKLHDKLKRMLKRLEKM